MKTKLVSIILLVLLTSCIRTLPDEELTMKQTPYYGKDLRLDGYYSVFSPDYNDYSILIFYRNGIVLNFSSVENYNKLYNESRTLELIRNEKEFWSIFQIENETIKIQGWSMDESYSRYLRKDIKKYISNDTTIYSENKKGDILIYHFKQFSPKPDSTNVFIK